MAVDPVPRLIDAAEWDGLEAGPAAADAGAQRLPARRLRRPADLRRRGGPAAPARDLLGLRAADAGAARPGRAAGDRRRTRPRQGRGRRPAGSGGQSADALRSRLRDRRPRSGRAGARRLARDRGRWTPTPASSAPRSAPPPPTGATSRPRRSSPTGPPAAPGTSTAGSAASWGSRSVEPDQLEVERGRLFARHNRDRRQLDVLYRRLDEDRLSAPDGGLTALGELLLPALESGRLRCVNAFGTGLADDKLAHAYAESMVRFYLGEEPLLRSVPSFDLSDAAGARGGDGPARRAGDQAARRLRRQGRDDHAAGDRAAAAAGDRPGAAPPRGLHRPGDGAALQPPDRLRAAGCGRAGSTCARSSSARPPAPPRWPAA